MSMWRELLTKWLNFKNIQGDIAIIGSLIILKATSHQSILLSGLFSTRTLKNMNLMIDYYRTNETQIIIGIEELFKNINQFNKFVDNWSLLFLCFIPKFYTRLFLIDLPHRLELWHHLYHGFFVFSFVLLHNHRFFMEFPQF